MKMTDVQVGTIYRLVDFRGKSGTKLLSRKVRVLETGISTAYSTRADRIKVMMLKLDNGEFVDDTRYDGKPWEKLIMAREIITEEEAVKREEADRLEREERERKAEERRRYQEELAKLVAMRLGISVDHVTTNSMYDEDTGEHVPYRAAVSQNGLKEMLAGDPDPVIIQDALDEIPYSTMTSAQIAEHIVGAMRKNGNGNSDE